MKNLLSEELERYQTLSNYNTKFTLTENTEIISENVILNERLGVELAAAEAAFTTIGKDLASFIKSSRLPKGETLESLLKMSDDSLKAEFTKAMNADLKITKANPNGLAYTSKEISKIMAVREITRLKPTTVADVDAIILKFKTANDLKFANNKLSKVGTTGAGTGAGTSATNKQNATNLGNTSTGKSLIAKIKAGMPWKTLLKVGAGIATVGVLWWLFTDNSPLPHPTPPPPPPQPSKYKTCPDTFPIAMYCKNETVRKVQGCLSIKTDSAFGPGTQSALVAKGLPGTEITQNTVDVACGSKVTPVVEPVVDPNVDLIDGEDPMNI